MQMGIETGGWCPNRRAEDGRIPEHYQLTELARPKSMCELNEMLSPVVPL